VFQDEVDVYLNPKIGSMWMRKGEQAIVETPGNNRKCRLAGLENGDAPGERSATPSQCRDVHRSLGRFALPSAGLEKDPRHLRLWQVAQLTRCPGVPGRLGPLDCASLPAEVRPGHKPDRASLMALARDNYAKPRLPQPGGTDHAGSRLVRDLQQSLSRYATHFCQSRLTHSVSVEELFRVRRNEQTERRTLKCG
jgi:hypothetical protein